MAVTDSRRLTRMEVLTDQKKPTVTRFLSNAIAWFNWHGIGYRRMMSNKSPAKVSKAFTKVCRAHSLQHISIQDPQHLKPRVRPIDSSRPSDGRWAITPYRAINNRLRKHSTMSWCLPQKRLGGAAMPNPCERRTKSKVHLADAQGGYNG